MRRLSGISLTVALLALGTAAQASAQQEPWQDRWFWGAQGGIFLFSTPTTDWTEAYTAGGHWYITKRNTALYFAFDELFFPTGTTSAVATGTTTLNAVNFTRGQRIEALLHVIPGGRTLQFHLGGGFAIQNITDAAIVITGTETAAQLQAAASAVERADSDAFWVFTGGFVFRAGGLALFTDYKYMPSSADFLITSSQHVFTAGLSISITSSRTEVSTN